MDAGRRPGEFLDRPAGDDPHDRLLLQIRGAVAEYERTLIADRLRRGRLRKYQAPACSCPGRKRLYGYRFPPLGHATRPACGSTRSRPPSSAEIYAWYASEGTSLMQLAMHLDARGVPTPSGTPRWSCATIRGILRNPTYTGQVYAQRTRYRAPTHRRSATHPIGRPHGTAVPQPAERLDPGRAGARRGEPGAVRRGPGQAGDEPLPIAPAQQHGAPSTCCVRW